MKRGLTILLGILPAIMWTCGEATAPKSASIAALEVEAVIAIERLLANDYTTTAEIMASEQVELKAPVSGNVMGIEFEEGQKVKKDQVLIRIDDRTWRAQIVGIEASLEALQKDLQRKRSLLSVEGSTEQEIDDLVAQIADMEAQLKELEVTIDLANVKAPFSGQIGLRNFSPGAYLSQGEAIATLAQTDELKVDFNLPEQYGNQLLTGHKVSVLVKDDSLEAVIYAIDPVVDVTSRTIRARAKMKQPADRNILPGAYAQILYPVKGRINTIVLPTQVVIPSSSNQFVFIYKGGKAVATSVTLGTRNDAFCEILSGINAGDTVISNGLLQLNNGMPVVVTITINTALAK